MFLIQSCMANTSLTLPATLPPTVYEQASGGRPPPTSPIARQNTGPASPMRQQYTGQLQPQQTGPSLSAQNTGRSAFPSAAPKPPVPTQQWDITPDAKATSDRFFSQLDTQNKGVIEGDVAVPFMLQSQLDEASLASIWDLADIRKEGKLTKDEFAVAMYLINGKLAGRDVPASLPNSLIPPSLRGEYSNQQEAPTSSVTKDLFDLFADDEPAAPVPAFQPTASPARSIAPQPFSPQAFLPQPPSRKATAPPPPVSRALSPNATGTSAHSFSGPGQGFRMPSSDLLGDDSSAAASSVPDRSVEIGNKQNQLQNTERSVGELEKQRADLERSAQSTSAQLEEIEQRLSSARVKHEAESKSVSDLRVRVGQQQDSIQKLNEDLISAESDLSAMRSEKDELEQTLLRDKEEVRGLQKKMKEVEDEKTGLKLALEKLKKEARQQKGMVSIAKKQLTTAEGSRDGVQNEIKTEEASQAAAAAQPREEPVFSPSTGSAAGIPLPATPAALSPVATGVSQRSNNPFDRLRNAAKSPTPSETSQEHGETGVSSVLLGAGAAVGLAAGVVAVGATTIFEAAKHAVSPDEEVKKSNGEETTASRSPVPETAESVQPQVLSHSASEHQAASHVDAPPVSHRGLEDEDEEDPFGASEGSPKAQQHVEVDPFGAPTGTAPGSAAQFDDFDSGFGDSFGAQQSHTAPAAASKAPDFDSDFDDSFATQQPAQPAATSSFPSAESGFEQHAASPPHDSRGIFPSSSTGTDFDSAPHQGDISGATTTGEPEFHSAFSNFGQSPSGPSEMEGLPSGIPKSAVPYLRPDAERTDSTQAIAPASVPDSPVGQTQALEHEDGSSDEDEGPEDLDRPNKLYATGTGGSQLASPQSREIGGFGSQQPSVPASSEARSDMGSPFGSAGETEQQLKTRRSAPPPPPSAKSSTALAAPIPIDDFDPFGAPTTTPFSHTPAILPPGAAAPVQQPQTTGGNQFDEDDFDFSDLPPAKVEDSASASTAHAPVQSFKDDFDFDDEFEKPSTGQGSEASTGMSKSYEMVSPPPQSFSQQGPFGGASGSQHYQQAMPAGQAQGAGMQTGASAFSFDDAFGNDFENG